MPKASIIIPVFNAERFIKETLDSIISQSWTDFECILIDDGSNDNTIDVISKFSDERIRLIKLEHSGGPAGPRNVGLVAAQGEYIFLFDADDVMLPDKLKISLAAFDANTNADILFTNFSSINEFGDPVKSSYLAGYEALWNALGGVPPEGSNVYIDADTLYKNVIQVNFIGTSSVAIRKNSLSFADKFNEKLSNSDDRLFWMLFCKKHNGVYVNQPLHLYRVQKNGISHRDFTIRGPDKIRALCIALESCTDAKSRSVLKKIIAEDYAGLSYSYQIKGCIKRQLDCALISFKMHPNLKSLKLIVLGLIKNITLSKEKK